MQYLHEEEKALVLFYMSQVVFVLELELALHFSMASGILH
jgi:hypothetical protein